MIVYGNHKKGWNKTIDVDVGIPVSKQAMVIFPGRCYSLYLMNSDVGDGNMTCLKEYVILYQVTALLFVFFGKEIQQ